MTDITSPAEATNPQAPVTNVYVTSQTAAALPPLSVGVAYVWWFFLGGVGAHQFYLGKTGRAISYIFTAAWLTVGLWIDVFTLPSQVRAANARRAVGIK
jgi:TM2 domain-containing membrane protein YozV